MAAKNEIMFHVENEINDKKQKVKPKKTNPILQQNDFMEYLMEYTKSKQDSL